jgi:hypothetical protein
MKLPRFLEKLPTPKTRAKAHTTPEKINIVWENKKRTINKLRQYRSAYENGGYISEAIDLYPLFMLSNGYQLQCAEGYDSKKESVQTLFDKIDITNICWMLCVDSLLVMDGIAEITYGSGKEATIPKGIYVRPAECFEIKTDEYGRPQVYIQKYDEDGNSLSSSVPLAPTDALHLKLIPRSDSVYGISLMRRAEDDINRDIDTIESIANAIKIHGSPKYQTIVNKNRPDAPPLTDDEYADLEKLYTDINSKDSFIGEGDIETNMLDVSGVQNVDMYSQVTLERVSAALGVPEELLGMRKGSTDATAVSRINAFFKKIQTHQNTLARLLNTRIIDSIAGAPGKVWIEFNDPDPSDNLKEAQFCKTIAEVNPLDPFAVMSPEQMRARVGVDEDQYIADMGVEEEMPDEQNQNP